MNLMVPGKTNPPKIIYLVATKFPALRGRNLAAADLKKMYSFKKLSARKQKSLLLTNNLQVSSTCKDTFQLHKTVGTE